MTKDDCYYLGYIVKPHGFKGAFQIKLDVSFPEEYIGMESLFVDLDEQLVPFFITDIQLLNNQKAKVTFEDVNDAESVKQLVGKQLFLPLDNLPELSGNHFYYHEIKGFSLYSQSNEHLGAITEVRDAPAQDLLVSEKDGIEILIPIVDDTIVKVNRQEQTIQVNIPDGLLELYTN